MEGWRSIDRSENDHEKQVTKRENTPKTRERKTSDKREDEKKGCKNCSLLRGGTMRGLDGDTKERKRRQA